jgi:WD40 repeat protein/serine/threonine protein kinase
VAAEVLVMATHPSCPSIHLWRQMLAEATPAAEQARLVPHLDECADCQRVLNELAEANPGLLSAVNALQRTAYSEEAPLRQVLDDLVSNLDLTILRHSHAGLPWLRPLHRPAETMKALSQLQDFEVTQLLGQGGMALVLKALERALNRWVAIKVLAPDLASDSLARQRFAREAQAAAAVHHENIVSIHAVSQVDGLPFLVMEYVAGGSLQDYLDVHGPPEWQEVARLGAEIASGLAAAHAHGLIHRDIKPSNILLQTEGSSSPLGTAKIGDFGLARAAVDARFTRTGVVSGTPMYMAPEQALGQALDERTDLFSLGSVLYLLCTGQQPFSASNAVALLRQVSEAIPRPVRELNPTIPGWLAAIVQRLHAKKPADRLTSAAGVAELLRYNLDHPDLPLLVVPPRRGKRVGRKRWIGVTAILASALLGTGLMLGDSLGWHHGASQGASEEPQDAGPALRATLVGHTGPVWSIAFAPDGHTVATGSDDTTLRLWDAATGAQISRLPGQGSAVFVVAFAHSGRSLLSGGGDGTIRLWNVATETEQPLSLHVRGNVRRLTISPDDRTMALGSSTQGVELWDLDTQQIRQTLSGHQSTILSIAFAADGRTLATGDASGHLGLWDTITGAEISSFAGDPLGIRALAFSPRRQILASAGTGGKVIKLWDTTRHRLISTLSANEPGAQSLQFSSDGHRLACGSRDGTIRIWDVESARLLADLSAHQGTVWSLAFSPDGLTLATAGEDRQGKLWDLRSLAGVSP